MALLQTSHREAASTGVQPSASVAGVLTYPVDPSGYIHMGGRPTGAPPLQHRRIDIGVNVRAANVKIGLKLLFSRLTAPSQPPTLAQKLVANEPMLTLQLHRLVFKAVFNNSVSFCFCLVSPPKGPARLLQSTFNSPLKEKKLINLHLLTTSGANPVQITQLATNN